MSTVQLPLDLACADAGTEHSFLKFPLLPMGGGEGVTLLRGPDGAGDPWIWGFRALLQCLHCPGCYGYKVSP